MQTSVGYFLAQHIQEAFITKNWCGLGVIPLVQNLTWQQATQVSIGNHSIAALSFHVQYYLQAIDQVLLQQPVTVTDTKSFLMPAIASEDDWQQLLLQIKQQVQNTCAVLQNAPDTVWETWFIDEKYGTVQHNIMGIIHHVYYHLGQMVLIQKQLSGPLV